MLSSFSIVTPIPLSDIVSADVWSSCPGVCGIEELPRSDAACYRVPERFHVVEFGTETAAAYAEWLQRDGYRSGDSVTMKVYAQIDDLAAWTKWRDAFQTRHAGIVMGDLLTEPVRDDSWIARGHLTGQCVGDRLWVGPPWVEPVAGRVAIVIEPGMAFGTGDHATTQLVLETLDRLSSNGFKPRRVLDIGTGSGVLSIAAAKLFVEANIWCTDLDPQCAGNFERNRQINGLDGRPVKTLFGPDAPLNRWDTPVTQFDLVMSNIFFGPLIALIPDIEQRLAHQGRWLVTGLLGSAQRDEFTTAAQQAGLEIESTREKTSDGHDLDGTADTWHLIEIRAAST